MYARAWSTGKGSNLPPLAFIRFFRICLSDVPPTNSITM